MGSYRWWIGGGVFLLLSGAVLASILLPKEAASPVFCSDPSCTITLTEHGFNPKELHIAPGTEVVFRSERTEFFWPASNLHPYHSAYPAFDPREPIDPSATWSFTFSEAGRYDFHDHLAPDFGGVIFVGDGAASEACAGAVPGSCWSARLRDTLENEGIDSAFSALKELYESDERFRFQCHLSAHDLGLLAYGKYGKDIPFSGDMRVCNDGFIHGFMEGFISQDEDPEDALAFCTRFGEALGDEHPIAGRQCLHGIGHGAMELILKIRPDLWAQSTELVEESKRWCDSDDLDDDGRFRCISGSYSVLATWYSYQDEYRNFFSAEDPYHLCSAEQDPTARRGCYSEVTRRIPLLRELAGSDPYELLSLIARTTRLSGYPDMVQQNLLSYLSTQSLPYGEGRDRAGIDLCHYVARWGIGEECIARVAGTYVSNGPPTAPLADGLKLCLDSSLTKREQSACAHGTIRAARFQGTAQEVDAACRTLSFIPDIAQYCQPSGANAKLYAS
jgi:plastocyanin